ncbi:hypothetical protein SUGI_0248350 [Cryptomeria japonica]|nr:hypothetical protein SUGI_0248350 [Cryptomeria japonica]
MRNTSKEISVTFEKVQRSYTTPPGWRLATFEEATANLESVRGLFEDWDRARLLDGWIGGSHFERAIGNEFKGCMGYMLITHVHAQASSSSGDSGKCLYEDVTLSFESKLVALQLSAEDWNHEVLYWILNSLDKTETMDLADVRDGGIPLRNASVVDEMKKLNSVANDLARQLWEAPFSEKEGSKRLDPRSIGDRFRKFGKSCWDDFTADRKKLLGRSFLGSIERAPHAIAELVEDYGNTTVSFGLGWQYFSFYTIMHYGYYALGTVMNKWLNDKSSQVSRSEQNFILSISLIFYYCHGYYYHFTRYFRMDNYRVLDTVLDVAATFGDVIVMKKMLDCGASLQITNTRTVLHTALHADVSEDKTVQMVNICLHGLEMESKEQLVNAADQKGMTALHLASLHGKSRVCELLLQCGAEPDVQDREGRLPLHNAIEKRNEQVIDLLIGKGVTDRKGTQMFSFQNSDGQSPLDVAAAQNNIKLITKLLPILEQTAESYIDKVDGVKLLHELAFQGRPDTVKKLLEGGVNPLNVDEEGKTALHYAAMCRDSYSAQKTIEVILDNCKDAKTLKAMVNWEGKTAFHFAALNGNVKPGLWPFEDLIDKNDMYDRSPLYYLLQAKIDSVGDIRDYIKEMDKAGIYFGDLVDSTGQTLLHVAASEGKVYQVNALLSMSRHPKTYVRRADYLGQTALHKAAERGHLKTIIVLLRWGAQPLLERDCDGRTAMHYAVQAKPGNDRIEVAKLLLKKCGSDDRKLLFLWASAAGLGSADQILNDCDPLKEFLLDQKKQLSPNGDSKLHRPILLKIAACIGDTNMTKELLARGGQIADIEDQRWMKDLKPEENANVQKVLGEIHITAEQGNDRPTVADKLGRDDFAHSLAALLLNPYLEPPIAIGISGSWGKGKSSLMIQTEINLLKAAAQSALLPTSELPIGSSFPGAQVLELSRKGKKKYKVVQRWVDFMKNDSNFNTSFFSTMINWVRTRSIREMIQRHNTENKTEESQGLKSAESQDSLSKFLHNYERKYHSIFKSLAAMDGSDMFSSEGQHPYARIDSPSERSLPAVLTVQYNAWMYRNESEALAGLAVEITKEMEGIMTEPQWLSTCLRNTWRKQKQSIWTELLFPCLLAIFLAGMFTWIVWILLDRYGAKEVLRLKYASLPAAIIFLVWTLMKSMMSIAKPVSTQLMNYIQLPDHSEKLGYQQRVISDINFLKEEIGKKPYFLWTVSSCIWWFIKKCFMIMKFYRIFFRDTMASPKAVLASAIYASSNPRIVVFVDDLDRCQESVILQVLSAINLVLAVCKISVIVGMDKVLIERAILKKYGDKSLKNSQQLADHYLQKIIQLPLDLPDPSEDESKRFLDTQLGVFGRPNKNEDPEADANDGGQAEKDEDYDRLFSINDRRIDIRDLGDHLMKMFSPESSIQDATVSGETSEATRSKGDSSDSVAIDVTTRTNTDSSTKSETVLHSIGNASLKPDAGNQGFSVSISIRDMLFVRYSEGERDAFCHFQKMATDCRKLPREWKRLLCYHRLVWYILYLGSEVNSLLGWQVQLITWIFTCWEWQENMNLIIENWNSIGILKASRSDSSSPSLRVIVEHFIKEESLIITDNKDEKIQATSDDKDIVRLVQDSENKELKVQDLKEKGVSENTEDPESSTTKLLQVKRIVKEKMPDSQGASSQTIKGETKEVSEHSENKEAAPETLVEVMNLSNISDDPESNKCVQSNEVIKHQKMRRTEGKPDVCITRDYFEDKNRTLSQKLDDVVRKVREEVEKALREEIDKTLGKEMDELHKEMDKLHKEIKELKEVKQQSGKNKKSEEERKTRLKTWKRMRSALRRYDVSMEGIIAFQRWCMPLFVHKGSVAAMKISMPGLENNMMVW